jgi:hypothetical protein
VARTPVAGVREMDNRDVSVGDLAEAV